MLYIPRLADGDCIVARAADESRARAKRLSEEAAAQAVAMRPQDGFAIRFSPAEDGSFASGALGRRDVGQHSWQRISVPE